MAAIGMMLGSAVANAFCFVGGNAIYGLVSKQGADEETARQNRAMEDLQRSSSEWVQRRQTRLDDEIRMEATAEKLNKDADEALRRYYEATGGDNQEDEEPTLEQFYQPSEEQKSTSSSSSSVA